MGLDSFLYVKPISQDAQILSALDDNTRVQVGYWRKNYAIHDKLSSYRTGDNDNCFDILLTEKDLKEILIWTDDLKSESESENTQQQGYEELKEHTQQGIKELKIIITKLLEETDFKNYAVVYYAWY
jgi:hypothetical protein